MSAERSDLEHALANQLVAISVSDSPDLAPAPFPRGETGSYRGGNSMVLTDRGYSP